MKLLGKGENAHRKRNTWFLMAVLLLMLRFCSSPHIRVLAQTTPSMEIIPAEGRIYLDSTNTIIVDVMLNDAVDMQSFEVAIMYDPDVFQLVEFEKGEFVSAFQKFYEVQSSGYLHVAYLKLGAPSVNGSGVLLHISFTGLATGISEITFAEGKYGTPQGEQIFPMLYGGSLKVLYSPVSVTGEVSLQGQADRGGVTVTLGMGETFAEGPYMAVSLDQAGANLDFGGVTPDTYPVTTSQPRYLNLNTALDKRVVISTTKLIAPLRLVSGNAVWTDDVIDAGDASLVGASYGMTTADLEPGETLDADLNFDDVVNILDLVLVAGNYGLTSEAAYAGWSP